jgi:hypothetical protein
MGRKGYKLCAIIEFDYCMHVSRDLEICTRDSGPVVRARVTSGARFPTAERYSNAADTA